MPTIATMRLLGGRACLDLVNTVDARRDRWGPDLLDCYDDLLCWAERIGLLTAVDLQAAREAAGAAPLRAEAALARAKTLREAIAAVIEASIEHLPFPAAPLSTLVAEIETARSHQTLVPDGEFLVWSWQDESALDFVVHRVALDAAALVTAPTLTARVKLCPGPNCGWLFLDESRNASRRWCRDEGCGTHARMHRYRAKPRLRDDGSA